MVQKTVNAKAKMGLRSSTMVRDLNIRCLRGHRPSNCTALKMQTQGTTGKVSKLEESRPKEAKSAEGKNPALPRSKSNEPGKTSYTDKRREYLEKKKKKRDRKNNTLATGDNATPLRLMRRRNGTTKATRGATIARRRANFRGNARNLQKTSVGLGNSHVGNWW